MTIEQHTFYPDNTGTSDKCGHGHEYEEYIEPRRPGITDVICRYICSFFCCYSPRDDEFN